MMLRQNIGFTGTRHGMTKPQKIVVARHLVHASHDGPLFLHHGDCIGADAEFHAIARGIGAHITGHLPTDDSRRAFCDFDEERAPKPYLDRNRDIVDEGDPLIAAPAEFAETSRGGTWSTVRDARRHPHGRSILIVWPDGRVDYSPRPWPAPISQ